MCQPEAAVAFHFRIPALLVQAAAFPQVEAVVEKSKDTTVVGRRKLKLRDYFPRPNVFHLVPSPCALWVGDGPLHALHVGNAQPRGTVLHCIILHR